MSIRAVLFDLGGVLVRTEDAAGRRKWEAQLGLAEREVDRLVFDCDAAIRATMGEAPAEAVWEHVGKWLKLDGAQLVDFQRDFWSGDRLDLELVSLLKSLRPRYKTAILSNAWSNARESFTQMFHLDEIVDLIIISSEERLAKPDARLYQRAALRLGVAPVEAVLVDDFVANVEGARAAGMQAIHYQPEMDVRGELEKMGIAWPRDGPE
jgi:epoxide hydrolase-like predicted phosphatase